MKGIASFLLLLCAASVFGGHRICYYTNWAQYRGGDGRYVAADVDGSLCDVVVYCFATMNGNEMATLEWNDETMYKTMNAHKIQHPSMKTVIAVGGASFHLPKMSSMLSRSESRSQFIQSTLAFTKKHNFDGVEFAFEHPGSGSSPATDKQRFTLFLQEFRKAIPSDRSDFLLTLGVPAGKQYIDNGYDIKNLSPEVDWFSIRSFDYNGSWQKVVGIGSPLFPREGQVGDPAQYNVKWTLEYYNSAGAPKSKLIAGFPAYARGWTLSDARNTDVGSWASGASKAWSHTKLPGMLAYYEICDAKNIYTDFTRKYHDEHKSPYAIFNTDQWISYDDLANIKIKVDWLKAEGYGGFMFWTLDYDDFKNYYCYNGKYPLLKAASDAMKA